MIFVIKVMNEKISLSMIRFIFISSINIIYIYEVTSFILELKSVHMKEVFHIHNIKRFFPINHINCYKLLRRIYKIDNNISKIRFINSYYKPKFINRVDYGMLLNGDNYYILHLKNMFVASTRELSDGINYYVQSASFPDKFIYIFLFEKEVTHLKSVENVIPIFDKCAVYYGDCIRSCVLLVILPTELISISFFTMPNYASFNIIRDIFYTLNLTFNYIMMDKRDLIYARNVYMIENENVVNNHFNQLSIELSKKIKESLGLKNVSNNNFVLFNRAKTGQRYLKNFLSLCKEIKQHFPDIPWCIYPPKFKNLRITVEKFMQIKFFFAVVGSNGVNLMFTEKNSGAVIISTLTHDMVFFILFLFDIACEVILSVSFTHNTRYGIFCPSSIVFRSIENVIYYLEHKKWKNNNDQVMFINGSLTPKKVAYEGVKECSFDKGL